MTIRVRLWCKVTAIIASQLQSITVLISALQIKRPKFLCGDIYSLTTALHHFYKQAERRWENEQSSPYCGLCQVSANAPITCCWSRCYCRSDDLNYPPKPVRIYRPCIDERLGRRGVPVDVVSVIVYHDKAETRAWTRPARRPAPANH